MAIPINGGQPSTQIIPVASRPLTQALPSVILALEAPITGGQPSTQVLPVVPGFGFTKPEDVAGMRSVWDAFDSATYDGTPDTTAIVDVFVTPRLLPPIRNDPSTTPNAARPPPPTSIKMRPWSSPPVRRPKPRAATTASTSTPSPAPPAL